MTSDKVRYKTIGLFVWCGCECRSENKFTMNVYFGFFISNSLTNSLHLSLSIKRPLLAHIKNIRYVHRIFIRHVLEFDPISSGSNTWSLLIWYCCDRVSFCNISVIQQDTQYLMINFIHNIDWLNMFQTSVVHLQERSYAVCCNLVRLDTLWGWRKNCIQ